MKKPRVEYVLLLLGVVGFFGFYLLKLSRFYPFISGDTRALLAGAHTIQACLQNGQTYCGGVVHFPIFQFIPALLLNLLHFEDERILRCLIYLNTLSVLGILVFSFWFALKKYSAALASFLIMIFLSGPLLWYGRASFNEATAAFLTLVFCAFCMKQGPLFWIWFFCVLSGLTKEVAPPFLFLLGAVCFGVEGQTRFRQKGKWVALLIGCLTSILLNGLFNLWRFQTFSNSALMDPHLFVPSFFQHALFFLALCFSPSGGLFVFWSSFGVLLAFILLSLNRRKKERVHFLQAYGVYLGACGILFGLILGFSHWYAPFGWQAWGPRFLVPWIPALSLVLVCRYAKELEEGLEKLSKRPWLSLGLFLGVLVMGVPQFSILFTLEAFQKMFAPGAECSSLVDIHQDSLAYYQCIHSIAWPQHYFVLSESLKEAVKFKLFWPLFGYGVSLSLLFLSKLRRFKSIKLFE